MITSKHENIQENIKTVLKGYNLSERDLIQVSSKIKYMKLKRGDKFLKARQICDKIGILVEGILMAKFETHKERNNVSRFFFHPENIIVTSFESFQTGKYSNETIEALEESTLLFITSTDLNSLYESIPAFNKIGRQIAEESYIKALQRIYDLQVYNVTERVQEFFKRNPSLYNKVNKKHLASYLRVNRNDLTKAIKRIEKQ